MSSLVLHTFSTSKEGKGPDLHIFATIAHTLASDLDHVVKVHADSNSRLETIEEDHHKEIEASDTIDLAHCKVKWKLEKLQ